MADNTAKIILDANTNPFVVGFDKAIKSVSGLEKGLLSIQSVAASALSFASIGLGAVEVIQLADAYGQMTGKLRLATQYSGDYAEVQKMLRDSARETRADLPATVQLYSQLSPALKGIGLNAKDSVGILTTINKAIVLSGASSQAAEAALVQLGQGFASGALRGEELNSIMEQTPALAQAIADGLGVSRGALRDMGADGKLTAEVVANALKKVADQVNDDFAKMPVTVGQALTNLKNEFLVFVGEVDSASGGTNKLATAINGLAEEVAAAKPFFKTLGDGMDYVAMAADGAYRVIKILSQTVVAMVAMTYVALQGNFKKVKEIYDYLGQQMQENLNRPLLGSGDKASVDAATNSTRQRLRLEQQLADEVKKLEQLKAYESGKASDNVAAKDKANIDARIADQQRLVEAVRAAWKASLAEAEKFALAAKEKLQKATDFRDTGKSAAFNASIKDLAPDEQVAAKSQRMSDLQSQGSYESARARMAALEGDIKKYDAAAAVAEKRLKEALQLAQDIGDVASIESISNDLAKNQEAGAKIDEKKAEEAAARAADQATLLNNLQDQLSSLQEKARSIEVQIDVTKAESTIKGLQAQLSELKDKTVTLTVKQIGDVAPIIAGGGQANPAGGETGSWARGGWTGPGGKYQVAGLVHADEFVHRQEVVRQPGALAFLTRFNQIGMAALRGYSNGGLVGNLALPSLKPAAAAPSHSGATVNLSLNGRNYPMSASDDVAGALIDVVRREALRKGGRR